MEPYGISIVILVLVVIHKTEAQCSDGRKMTFARWSGVSPEQAAPVFMYAASGDEESLAGACLARCRELDDCAAVVVAYTKGNCHGVADTTETQLRVDNDVAYFKKICLELPDECAARWWAVEVTPGYNLHAEGPHLKVILNATVHECYDAVFTANGDQNFRSAQWVGADGNFNAEIIKTSDFAVGNCILNAEDKFTEPESYRVSNYYTLYMENQCRYDYPKKIDRCSYEEYNNQTLKHVEFTISNYTKDECKTACEIEERFVCRGFSWISRREVHPGGRGLCDLHSEDLVTTGSWLLRRTAAATYYRRVICLNLSVECSSSELIVTYRPRGVFRGRVYVPGRGEQCGAGMGAGAGARAGVGAAGGAVRLALPLRGDCDVNFAYGIYNGPNGLINRTMAYVMVMIQNNPIIQTAGDRWVRVGCSPESHANAMVDATVAVRDARYGNKKPSSVSESSASPPAASAVFGSSSSPLTMYVVREQDDVPSAAAVSLGETLELRVETTDENEIEPYHLVASSRQGDSSVLLLDSKGCPTGQVDFPSFNRSWLRGTQRLSAKFKAFRFPTSHVVRFTLFVRYCNLKCVPFNCGSRSQGRIVRETNGTYWSDEPVAAGVKLDQTWDQLRGGVSDEPVAAGVKQDRTWDEPRGGVVAQGGAARCGNTEDGVPLELEMHVDSKDMLSADTLVRADHRGSVGEEGRYLESGVVCVHELLVVALALAWLAVQLLLLLGCCVLVKRYRNLAELSMQKDYQSFDNVGFDTVSTHRRVHWPDQNIDILHVT